MSGWGVVRRTLVDGENAVSENFDEVKAKLAKVRFDALLTDEEVCPQCLGELDTGW